MIIHTYQHLFNFYLLFVATVITLMPFTHSDPFTKYNSFVIDSHQSIQLMFPGPEAAIDAELMSSGFL